MTQHCKRCGVILPTEVLAGHCPRCLVQVSLELAPQGQSIGNTPDLFPRLFGDYELLEEIARGGMGVVYRARQITLGRDVAVKMILSGEFAGADFVRRFRKEAAAAAGLQHPNIVAVHEFGEHQGQHYFSMEYVDGPNLAQLVRDQPLGARRAAEHLKRIAEAVEYAHQRGILHRDLKPSNILIDPFDQPRITDFGLARQLTPASDSTVTAQAIGSPAYSSPEQAAGRAVDRRSEVYSLGAILYHLLTARAPFQGETLHQVILQVQHNEPIGPRNLNPGVPADLETICLKCLEKDPARRYASASALAEELTRFLQDEPIHARPVGRSEKLWRWCRRRPAVASLAASVALLLSALAAGATLAAWRIDVARRAERNQRQAAVQANVNLENANARLAQTVSALEMRRADALFRSGDAGMGLAQLARVLRHDPSNHIAAERIMSSFLHRNWVLPAGPPLKHPAPVSSVAFSPNGKYIVTGCADGSARLWDAQTGHQMGTDLKHPAHVRSTCFSPDGTLVATGCDDGNVRIWNWQTAAVSVGPLDHEGWIFSVAFSPNGDRVVSASRDHKVCVWSTDRGELLFSLSHRAAVRRAVFSPDGERIATVSYDGSIRLWNSQTGVMESLLRRPSGKEVFGVAFSPDGHRLATSSRDHTAIIWDLKTLQPAFAPMRSPDGLNDIQFEPSGRLVVTAGYDNAVRLWDAQSGVPLSQPFRHREQVNQAAFSSDGRTLATAGDDWLVKFWDVRPSQALAEPLRHPRAVNWAEFSPSGQIVATASADHTARLWDPRTGLALREPMRHGGPVYTASFSGDGRFVVTASTDYTPWIWDTTTGARSKGLFMHTNGLATALFSADGSQLVTASKDNTARVWDIKTHQPVTAPLVHSARVRAARFSPDAKLVVTASDDGTARIWDAKTGAQVGKTMVHEDRVVDARFSPNGNRIVTASMDNTARLWNPSDGEPIGHPLRHFRAVQSINFSPEGRLVVTASLDHTARIWNAATGEPVSPPLEHEEAVSYSCFSTDGQRVLTASIDRTARIWDVITGLPLSESLLHKSLLALGQFSSTGERIVTATQGSENSARIWEVPLASSQVPEWLPAMAEAVAGLAVEKEGATRLFSEPEIEQLQQQLCCLKSNDNFARLARWFLADRSARTISPFLTETVPQYVVRRINEDTLSSLREAIWLDPTNSMALARLAQSVLASSFGSETERRAEAVYLAKRALRFSPELSQAEAIVKQASR